MSTLYSQMKPAWHFDRIEAIREGRPVVPVHVQLILSDLCNQDCHFCAYRMSNGLSSELFPDENGRANPNRRIPTEKAREIIEDCAALGVRAIQFTGGGEPTVHPDHLELFALAQQLGIETALVTNGVKLDPTHPGVLGMTWIRVSVDAGDPAAYALVRRVPNGHWDKAWANIRALGATYTGTLGVGFVVTRENWFGIRSACRLAKAAGATNVRIGAVFSAEGQGYYSNGSQADLDQFVSAVKYSIAETQAELDDERFRVLSMWGRRMTDLEEGSPEHPRCGYQHLNWYIGGDLNVYRCCNTAYTLAGKVGSLKDARLADIIGQHEPFDARGCHYCQFRGQNQAINALVERPTHENFV